MMLSQDWTRQRGPLADGVEPPYNWREEERESRERERVNYTVALQGCSNPRAIEETRRFNGFWEFLIGISRNRSNMEQMHPLYTDLSLSLSP